MDVLPSAPPSALPGISPTRGESVAPLIARIAASIQDFTGPSVWLHSPPVWGRCHAVTEGGNPSHQPSEELASC
jgi:hypothetical protein